jgi:DNA polymerase-3 subunit delta'
MECVEAAGKESALQRTRARLVVRLAIDLISDVLALHQHHEPQRGEAEDQAALQNLVRRTDTEVALSLLERCLEADRHIERRVQLILAVEAWLDTLARTLA